MDAIPILNNHDHTNPIGMVRSVNGRLCVEFFDRSRITSSEFFRIFGGVGIRITESESVNGVVLIKKCEILEFSLPAPQEAL